MADTQTTHAPATPPVIRREDYQPPLWLVDHIRLEFDLDAHATRVKARLSVTRAGRHDRPLRLDGDGLVPLSVAVDGKALSPADWRLDDDVLVIALPGNAHEVETEVQIAPATNTQLMGLYASGGLLCTQCEPEGFRRITFFPDRPDVLSRYDVTMRADKATYPVLLANGDPVEQGELPDGRHWARWVDPYPKPSYLFAMVAGDLACNADSFTTMSGRAVRLGIWVREEDLPRTSHAMTALKNSMAWDERVYGREYDLDVFNIVAVSDFNFGAMENKGLNIFNSRYVLADPETATDPDYDAIESVVAHEYFHNWSGDRVTCRDWFQLSLKEGFTVYRDQCFSADMGSAAVKRIEDVRTLRAAQFQEDAGPLAHPVRPESYMEISNFYTATVYNKGAELIRMIALLLGPERFRQGTDLYFERHDGQAVTCEDFVKAMEDGGGIDLGQFRLWYSQAGTPRLTVRQRYDPASGSLSITLRQTVPPTPGQPEKAPMAIPVKFALFDPATGEHGGEELVVLTRDQLEMRREGFAQAPVLSLNRGFAAPVIVEAEQSAQDLAFLAARDDDPFSRYEAMQQLMINGLLAHISGAPLESDVIIDSIRRTITDPTLDRSFVAEAVRLPSEAYLGDQMQVVDPDAIHAARERLMTGIGEALESEWRALHAECARNGFSLSADARAARKLRGVALSYLVASGAPDGAALAFGQFDRADNMTERQAALAILVNRETPERDQALAAFYRRYAGNALVVDKWFQTQALAFHPDTVEIVQALAGHADFTLANPNRARALYSAFAANQWAFNRADGKGYRMVADAIIALDKLNPQTAARLVPPLGRWRRFDGARGAMMRAELERIAATPGLSRDVLEQATKSLA
ncbi:aminopeptidase N [Sphingobium lignivorans]|uniref:Aminopeptidase N n=1 Tax=Sphingobium lignivorans TaxID=2735886 RepID=A0ABR6NL13_9SPHN|nr:aminopeptidase N [Sphingobium lignivorans]MBB5987973.1 aminopeptidase N [Sphingobium lignivorans]